MGVPILCYHSIAETVEPQAAEFTVTPRSLAAQMTLLRRLGYKSLTLRELVEAFDAGVALDTAIVLTFDDGYKDTATVAQPILEEHGFRGTVFVITKLVGSQRSRLARAPMASWDDLKRLAALGWEIGLHSATHPDLTTLDEARLRLELVDARRRLEATLNTPVSTVAYPWGRYSAGVVSMTQRSGAVAAATVTHALASRSSNRYALPRCAVRRGDSLFDLRMTLRCGWNLKSLARLARRQWDAVRAPRVVHANRRPAPQGPWPPCDADRRCRDEISA